MLPPFALIAEPSHRLGDEWEAIMRAVGYGPQVVWDGWHAIQRLGERRPDLLILAMQLPVSPGEQVLSFIQEYPGRFEGTRIIVLAEPGDIVLPVDALLVRPINREALRALAAAFLPPTPERHP